MLWSQTPRLSDSMCCVVGWRNGGSRELSDVDPKSVGHVTKVRPLFRTELKGEAKDPDF